jgi:integrase
MGSGEGNLAGLSTHSENWRSGLPTNPGESQAGALPLPRNAAMDRPYYFWNAQSSRRAVVGIAERTLAAVFKKSGVKDAHAHRYRHTLATRLLEGTATFEDVADILGNSVEVVRKHYAKWSPSRQAKIDHLMLAHFQTAVTNPVTKSHT